MNSILRALVLGTVAAGAVVAVAAFQGHISGGPTTSGVPGTTREAPAVMPPGQPAESAPVASLSTDGPVNADGVVPAAQAAIATGGASPAAATGAAAAGAAASVAPVPGEQPAAAPAASAMPHAMPASAGGSSAPAGAVAASPAGPAPAPAVSAAPSQPAASVVAPGAPAATAPQPGAPVSAFADGQDSVGTFKPAVFTGKTKPQAGAN